jgi:large subunit ribosomal protein L9
MKVILHREVEKLGAPGDVVEVADGYARNYLIPRKLAAPASEGAVKHAQQLRRGHDERVRKALAESKAIAEKLVASPLRVKAKAGEDGRLFGSITANELAKQLQERSEGPIDRRQIHLAEPIRNLGTHEITVRLHPEVNATVTVEVVRE